MFELDYDTLCSRLKAQGKRFNPYRSRIPEGCAGPWSVERFKVAIDLANMRAVRDGRGCSPGTFTRLRHANRGIVMSDTDAEISDFLPFLSGASGAVLVAGLGLGCVTQALLAKKEVKRVTVVEVDADVISLVEPHLRCPRLEIVYADAFKWQPPKGVKYECGWYDIWDEICGDNVAAIRKMTRHFKSYVESASVWCYREMLRANQY